MPDCTVSLFYMYIYLTKIKIELLKLFNTLGLKITLDTHLSKVDFLDVTLDLRSEQFKPYRKANNTPL